MEGTKKIKSTSFHQYSWNFEVETTWISLIGWPHKTSTKYYVLKVGDKTYRESFLRINFYHASEKVLTIGRYKVGYVKVAPLDFFQELSKIVIVERKGSNQQGIQNHTARPNICPSAIVLLPLKKSWYIRTYGSKVFYQVAFSFSVYLISL